MSSSLFLSFPKKDRALFPHGEKPAYRVDMPVMWPEKGQLATGILEMQDYLIAQLEEDNAKHQKATIKEGGNTLKTKTLLINEKDLEEKLNIESVKKAYPYKFEIAPYSKIEDAILRKDPAYIYVQISPTSWRTPEGVTHRIYDAEIGKVVAMTIGSGNKINAKHFKYYQHYIKK